MRDNLDGKGYFAYGSPKILYTTVPGRPTDTDRQPPAPGAPGDDRRYRQPRQRMPVCARQRRAALDGVAGRSGCQQRSTTTSPGDLDDLRSAFRRPSRTESCSTSNTRRGSGDARPRRRRSGQAPTGGNHQHRDRRCHRRVGVRPLADPALPARDAATDLRPAGRPPTPSRWLDPAGGTRVRRRWASMVEPVDIDRCLADPSTYEETILRIFARSDSSADRPSPKPVAESPISKPRPNGAPWPVRSPAASPTAPTGPQPVDLWDLEERASPRRPHAGVRRPCRRLGALPTSFA